MDLFEKARSSGLLRHLGILHDMVIAAAAFFVAYVTAIGWTAASTDVTVYHKTLIFVAAAAVIFFFVFSLQRGSWRYVSIPEFLTIVKASLVTSILYTFGSFLVSRGFNFPRQVPVLATFYLIAGLAGPRLGYRLFLEGGILPISTLKVPASALRHVLLLGLNDSAESFIRLTRRGSLAGIRVVGILDEAPQRHARSVQGVRVYGALSDLEEVVGKLGRKGIRVAELVITEASPSRQRLGQIVELATSLGIKASRLPDLAETSQLTSNSLLEPKAIELGDLLGRPEVATDLPGIASLINGRTVLVTGAGGSIGSELCRQIALLSPRRLIITDSSEFHLYSLDIELREKFNGLRIETQIVDVRDGARVREVFQRFSPEAIFHAAALKHVPLVEANPLEAIKTNLFGTRNVADAALAAGAAACVMISTDKAVNPTNVMGATKRAAEAYCQALDISSEKTRYKTVRFGNVLGSNGSVVPRFQEQIASGGPLTVTHPEVVRYFMTIPEAVRLVLHASAHALRRRNERGKIMVLDMGEPVRIVQLAERMIQLAGLKPYADIDIVFTGLRPGEKLYEELFDPSEVQNEVTVDGYMIASPRIIDKALLARALASLESAVAQEDAERALEFLAHIVPEYRKDTRPVPDSAPNPGSFSQQV
ncbi:nucleoside-diphosphate sugar epimerase/dehydratase [Mesorhizobium sp. BAC0120]|uniref:polysaccharide biosynthesis protein n=1 Tax=Mesorhizobium sp. BAC0120 TaxID=3090670 RepID=UPI00298C211B|nr:nucleoside-diphosphate sugar epimerase/dehydratase [Mesorhizobium sp. BAC0120]MDW6020951.1 nucleoside-diphosphate sugar epimerase/dehydratase [Mesorhizobium sp. BAC0120]